MELTKQDINTLIEAVEAWEKSSETEGLMGHMFGLMTCTNEVQYKNMREEQDRMKAADAAKKTAIKERGVLLRAKLISIRDEADVDSFLAAR